MCEEIEDDELRNCVFIGTVKYWDDDKGKYVTETKPWTSQQILSWYEFRDLEPYTEYNFVMIEYIDKNEDYVIHPLTFASKLTNWEYGSHYVFLIKGKKVIESEVDCFENIVDSKFYGTDH